MLPIAQTFSKNDIFALIPTLPEMGSIQSQHGLRSQNANRMLTLFRKICFDGKNSQSLVPTVKTPETPVKSRVSGVLKGAEKRSKCSKRHPLPTTRNQFAGNRTRVRIPPAAPESRNNLDVRGGKPRVPSCFGFFYAQNSSFTGMDVCKRKIEEDLSPCGKMGVKRQGAERS